MTTFPAAPVLHGTGVTFKPVSLKKDAFLHPFYDDGVAAHAVSGYAVHRQNLDELPLPAPHIPLRAIIFHLSHCGSTLLGQLLSVKTENRVISEAELINSILLSHVFNGHDEEVTVSRLRKAMGLLLQPLDGTETAGFVKFTSWNLFHAELFAKAFPGVPLWYVHRDPLAVLSSLWHDPQGFASWNLHAEPLLACRYLGVSKEDIRAMNQQDFIGQMLLKHMRCALELPPTALFLPYPEWIDTFFATPGPATGFTETEIMKARNRLRFDAKQESVAFQPASYNLPGLDTQLKRSLDDAAAEVYAKWSDGGK